MTFPTGWARKCAITIDSAQVAGSGTHLDFPVCLTKANLPSDMLDKDGSHCAQMGGGDIRFSANSDGSSPLPCHVIEFITNDTPANGQALIYVAVDLPATTDTTIYVWYAADSHKEQPKYNDNPDADGFQGSDYVWANYEMMYALGGLGGLRNLKQGNGKNLGRAGTFNPKTYTVRANASGNRYVSFPSLIKVGDRLYCSAREATDHVVTLTGSVGVYYSDDLGRTWTNDTGLYLADASFDLRDPKLFLHADGSMYVFYSKTNAADTSRVVTYRRSVAPFTSWGSETALTTQTRANGAGKVITLASGRIIVPCYDVPVTDSAPFVRWSDDQGATWTTDFLTSDGNAPGTYGAYNEFSVAEDPLTPNSLVAILRRNGFTNLYRQTSTDGGETWSSAASNVAFPDNPDMPELSYCQDGDLLLAHAHHRGEPDFYIRRSTDNGATWDGNVAILWSKGTGGGTPNGLTGGGGYCSFVEVSKGLFAAVYFYDGGSTVASVFCTHVTKTEDGVLSAYTDTNWSTAGTVNTGVELSDAGDGLRNTSLSFFNQVHNGSAFTISGWAKFNQISDELHGFCGSSASAADTGFFFGYENRAAVSAPDALRIFKASGTSINSQTAAISADTSPHRFGVFASATSTPTFIKDATTYVGSAAITATAGNATRDMRVGGVSFSPTDLAAGRLDGWMEMWGFSAVNLGVDYETTRYNSEAAPGTFAAAGTSTSTDATPPTLAGSIAVTSLTTTSYTLTCPVATDNVGVVGYQYRINAGAWTTIAAAGRAVGITGRTPGATDSVEMRAFDDVPNYSTALSDSVTLASAADTTAPTLTGSITVGAVTSTSIAITWPTGADNVAVSSYEVNRGAGWVDTASTSTGYTFTGLTASTAYTLQVRAKDAAGNVSTPALSVSQSTAAEAPAPAPAPAPVSQGSRRLTLPEWLRGVT